MWRCGNKEAIWAVIGMCYMKMLEHKKKKWNLEARQLFKKCLGTLKEIFDTSNNFDSFLVIVVIVIYLNLPSGLTCYFPSLQGYTTCCG